MIYTEIFDVLKFSSYLKILVQFSGKKTDITIIVTIFLKNKMSTLDTKLKKKI